MASYTYNDNQIINIDDVDVENNTFYSAGHGMADGWYLLPSLKEGVSFDEVKAFAGMPLDGWKRVINATEDTFQVIPKNSLSGDIMELEENPDMDLSKWHFEAVPSNGMVTIIDITDLPPKKKYRVRCSYKSNCGKAGSYLVLCPSEHNKSIWWGYQSLPCTALECLAGQYRQP